MASTLLCRLRSLGFTVTLEGERLLCSPSSRLTDELRKEIRTHKTALVHTLARRETAERLQDVYREHGGGRLGQEDWERLSAADWTTRLRKLEQAFLKAWWAGKNPLEELAALREHWRETPAVVKGGCTDGRY